MLVEKREIIVWICIFVTLMSIMAAFGMVILLINNEAAYVITPYLLGSIAGALSVEVYLWICVTATFIFLGITCIIIYRKQPPNPEIVKLFLKVG